MTANIINLKNININIKDWIADDKNVYVGRPSKWGNPYKISKKTCRKEAVNLFRNHVIHTKDLADNVGELRGKILGCWCAPDQCHAEVLHQLAGNHPLYQTGSRINMDCPPDGNSNLSKEDVNNENHGTPNTRKVIVGNLPTNATIESLTAFFDLHRDEDTKSASEVELSKDLNQNNIALLHIPDGLFKGILQKDGEEFHGRMITVRDPAAPLTKLPGEALSTLAEVASASTPITAQTPNIYEYVMLDATRHNNPYNIPSHSAVVHAIRCQFPDGQSEQRKIIRLWGSRECQWKIEAANYDRYRGQNVLLYNGQSMATIEIKQHHINRGEDGNTSLEPIRNNGGRQDHSDNDLLITLVEADTARFASISNEKILEEIIKMDVGNVKKAPQPQRWSRETDELNGNKFCVLSGVSKEDAQRIPPDFEFNDKRFGVQRMRLNHKYKIRYCFYCGQHHDYNCALKEAEKRFVREREEAKREVKIYGSSELRYCQQSCLASDIDSMSGGTTGNILNAIDVDEENNEMKNVVIVAGQNELHNQSTPEEFILSLKEKQQRLKAMSTDKVVALLEPPAQKHIDPVQITKDIIFRAHLKELDEYLPNLRVWENPIQMYEEDDGRHPSPEQTSELLHFIDKKAQEDMGVSIFLPSGPNDYIITRRKYSGVRSLYKYGCGACSDRERNKWWGLCMRCVDHAKAPADNGLAYALKVFNDTLKQKQDIENPSLGENLAYGQQSNSTSHVRERSP